jgi:hypothetical protein
MDPLLIKPRQSLWEKTVNKVSGFSPQVKQGLITAGVALVVGLAGLLVPYLIYSKENSSLKQTIGTQDRTIAG